MCRAGAFSVMDGGFKWINPLFFVLDAYLRYDED